MCSPAAAVMGSAALQAYGQVQQGRMAAQAGRNNEIMAGYAAENALAQGEEAAAAAVRQGEAVKGAQRAAFAGGGVDVNFGTARDLQEQTDFFAQNDAATARGNARRDAWALRYQGATAAAEGRAARRNSYLSAGATLLGAAGTVAGKWYKPGAPNMGTPQAGP